MFDFIGLNNINDSNIIPAIFINNQHNFNYGIDHDFYNVYVNGKYIGKKVLLTQAEKIKDLEKYLHTNNFNKFVLETDGNSVYISDDNSEESKQIKETLNVYLNIN